MEPVGLWTSRHMLRVTAVDQPRLEPVRFQEVEHRLHVIAGRFHHPPLDAHVHHGWPAPRANGSSSSASTPPASASSGSPAQGPGHNRRVRLAGIQGREHGDNLSLSWDSARMTSSSPHQTPADSIGGRPQGPPGKRNLVLVLGRETVKGPPRDPRRPAS